MNAQAQDTTGQANAVVVPVMLNNCSSWAVTTTLLHKLDACHRSHLRSILGMCWPNGIISNDDLYVHCGTGPLSQDRCHRTAVTGPLSQDRCHRTAVTGPLSQDRGHRTAVTGPLSQDRCHSKYGACVDPCSTMCYACPRIPPHNCPYSLRLLGQIDTGAGLAGTSPTYLTYCTRTSKRRASSYDRTETM